MDKQQQILEGTWEDIIAHDAELKGRRVRLTILNANGVQMPFIKNGADLMAYWENEGVLGSREETLDSVTYAQELRKKAETRN